MTAALEMSDVSKEFDGNRALDDARFRAEYGRVHALLGENGAGKSSLMNVVCGLYAPDRGRIAIDGVPVTHRRPGASARARHRHGASAFQAGAPVHRGRERGDGEPAGRALDGRAGAGFGGHRALLRRARLRPRPRCADRFDLGRRAPAGRDRQGADVGRPHPDPRRADGGADRRRGRPPAGRGARPRRARRGRGADHPQAARGPRFRRPGDDHARRADGRRGGPEDAVGPTHDRADGGLGTAQRGDRARRRRPGPACHRKPGGGARRRSGGARRRHPRCPRRGDLRRRRGRRQRPDRARRGADGGAPGSKAAGSRSTARTAPPPTRASAAKAGSAPSRPTAISTG